MANLLAEEGFFKLNNEIYPCIFLHDCVIGAGDNISIFNDKIKETHYLYIRKNDIRKATLFRDSFIKWTTKNGILNIKGKFVEPICLTIILVDINDNDETSKSIFHSLNFLSVIEDNMYYEIIDNGDKKELYLDVYCIIDNRRNKLI